MRAHATVSKTTTKAHRLRRKDAVIATDRLGSLCRAGMSTGEALALGKRSRDGAGKILGLLDSRVRRGRSLSAAMSSSDGVFSEAEVALIKAGELSGNIGCALGLLAESMEAQSAAARKIFSALAYPCFLALFSLAVLVFLSAAVLPPFASLYAREGRTLPALTRALLDFGDTFRAHAATGLALLAASAGTCSLALRRSQSLALICHRRLLKLPVAGPIAVAAAKSRSYALISALVGSGCEVDKALKLAAAAASNLDISLRLRKTSRILARGSSLSRAWRRSGLDLDGSECGFLEIAEARGDYQGAFTKLARINAVNHRQAIERFSAVAEPAAVIFMAVTVSAGAMALYQPILGSASMVSQAF